MGDGGPRVFGILQAQVGLNKKSGESGAGKTESAK